MTQLALIGMGVWGRNFISTINSFTDCRIKYICSKTTRTLKSIRGDYIKTIHYEDLFKYSDIDGVIIATPSSTHYEISQEFLKRGFNLLIEKPLATNYIQALKLQSLCQNSRSKVLLGHTYLFDPAYNRTKELAQTMGQIRFISYEGLNNGPIRPDTSVLWDWGPHAISLCLDIYQEEPVQISAWALDTLRPKSGFFDLACIKLTFFDQSEAFIKISWLFPFKKRELVIVGSKSAIIYNDLVDKKVTYYRDIVPNVKRKGVVIYNPKVEHPKYDLKPPLEMEIREFVDAIKNDNKTIRSDLNFGVKVTKMIHLAEQSIRHNGTPIHISRSVTHKA